MFFFLISAIMYLLLGVCSLALLVLSLHAWSAESLKFTIHGMDVPSAPLALFGLARLAISRMVRSSRFAVLIPSQVVHVEAVQFLYLVTHL